MTNNPLEDRIAVIEKEIETLKRRIRPNGGANWIDEVSGSMQRFPEFDEVVRLGQEFRRSQNDPHG